MAAAAASEQAENDDVTTATLADLIQALPPEPFNKIVECTFTPTSGEEVDIFDWSKPPSRLQVSHATRRMFAESYYSNTIFYIASDLVQAWFSSLEIIDFQELKVVCYPALICRDDEGDRVYSRIRHEYDALAPWIGDVGSFRETIKFEVLYKVFGAPQEKLWLSVSDVEGARLNGEWSTARSQSHSRDLSFRTFHCKAARFTTNVRADMILRLGKKR